VNFEPAEQSDQKPVVDAAQKPKLLQEQVQCKKFPARFSSLEGLRQFVGQIAEACNYHPDEIYHIELVTDEAFSNIVEHAYAGECDSPVECKCQISATALKVILVDQGERFDPQAVPQPGVKVSLEERERGGLGLFFMRKWMDDIQFESEAGAEGEPGRNILTMVKQLPEGAGESAVPAQLVTPTPPSGSTQSEKWKQVVYLGQQLLIPWNGHSLRTELTARSELVAGVASQLLEAHVDLWLSPDILRLVQARHLAEEQQEQPSTAEAQLTSPAQLTSKSQSTAQSQFTESAQFTASPQFTLAPPSPWMQRVLDDGNALLIRQIGDCEEDSLQQGYYVMAIPIRSREGVLYGAMEGRRPLDKPFIDEDHPLFESIGNQFSIALQAVLGMATEQHQVQQLKLLSEVSSIIASQLDADILLNEVVELVQKRFGYPYIHCYTVQPGRNKVIYEAGSGARSQAMKEAGFMFDLSDLQGIVAWVARNGETILANDVEKEPRYLPSPLPPANTRAELAVPLIYGEEILGVLDVQSDQLNAFGEQDRFLFEALSDHVSIALHNANQYRAETWRRQVAESLREVAGLLSADVDLDQVLDAILKELVRNLPCDLAAIWLLDHDDYDPDVQEGLPPLRLAAVHGPLASVLDLAEGLTLSSFIDCGVEGEVNEEDERAAEFLEEALQADKPLIRSSFTPPDPLALALNFTNDYSAIAAPLRVGDQRLGELMLIHHTTGRYGNEATSMTTTFSSYAAVAIENARLYEAAHEQAWVSTVLLQVAEATQTITNLNELIGTVVKVTPMLVGIKACAIYTLNDGDVFIPAASSGLSPQGQTKFDASYFTPGDLQALDDLLSKRKPSILRLDGDEQKLSEIFFQESDPNARQLSNWIIVAPFLGREELLGAFMVLYRPEPTAGRLEAMFEETISIIQGISQQTAMAIENIGLAKSQQEEAYVSVALLQVAQAVVSNNDLNDILGSIVRITPILVGIRRVAVFLRDPEQETYLLAQSYGLPRNAEGQVFTSADFPLLERVAKADGLLACPVADGAPGTDVLDHWKSLQLPADDEFDELLESESSLLLAFPLTVKGEVLGAFVVEEPGEGKPGTSIQRSREKRLEITTGISQQTALAIQNDRFQREMVNRERLDREMQLAREIQRTFLPHHIPDPPGWELNVYWRPAREVAGDFYDFFELPGNRLGMVIADVADKGIPAALFMTLVRTLMRATVYQVSDPAEVLAHVNDVLVPDAEQGMFVTLFYAILSIDTGELAFANAGHNRPMVFEQAQRRIFSLQKGEIALGVLENSHFNSHNVTLNAGDFLVMFTDGITEAFSPQDDMYGDAGLSETITMVINSAEVVTAIELLESIDSSVQQFVGDAPLLDDLTLVVLHRL
jgi:sigma-B regulation protein RsbU (phosphoserine phosphatase)